MAESCHQSHSQCDPYLQRGLVRRSALPVVCERVGCRANRHNRERGRREHGFQAPFFLSFFSSIIDPSFNFVIHKKESPTTSGKPAVGRNCDRFSWRRAHQPQGSPREDGHKLLSLGGSCSAFWEIVNCYILFVYFSISWYLCQGFYLQVNQRFAKQEVCLKCKSTSNSILACMKP